MARNIKRQHATESGQAVIRIGDRTISKYVAKFTYRCEECFGELQYHNAGLTCKLNKNHRGFIHQSEAESIRQKQITNIKGLQEFYVIKDGKVQLKNGN